MQAPMGSDSSGHPGLQGRNTSTLQDFLSVLDREMLVFDVRCQNHLLIICLHIEFKKNLVSTIHRGWIPQKL